MAECNHAVIQQKIYSKISKFQNECDILDKNVGLCRRIAKRITDIVVKGYAQVEPDNMNHLNDYLQTSSAQLDVLKNLFKTLNNDIQEPILKINKIEDKFERNCFGRHKKEPTNDGNCGAMPIKKRVAVSVHEASISASKLSKSTKTQQQKTHTALSSSNLRIETLTTVTTNDVTTASTSARVQDAVIVNIEKDDDSDTLDSDTETEINFQVRDIEDKSAIKTIIDSQEKEPSIFSLVSSIGAQTNVPINVAKNGKRPSSKRVPIASRKITVKRNSSAEPMVTRRKAATNSNVIQKKSTISDKNTAENTFADDIHKDGNNHSHKTQKEFVCQVCGKILTTGTGFKYHTNRHANEQETGKHRNKQLKVRLTKLRGKINSADSH